MYLEQIRQLALDETTAPKILTILAKSQDRYTRKNVAINPNTTTATLLSLSLEFPSEVMNNPVLPLLILENPYLFICQIDLDFPQLKHLTDIEIYRLGWSKKNRDRYLKNTYGRKNRAHLTDEQQYDFLCQLKLL